MQTSMREANDRGYDCLLVEDATESYFPEFKAATMEMIRAQGAIVGWTAPAALLMKGCPHDALHTLADWRQAYADGTRPADRLPALVDSFEAADTAWIWRAPPAFVLEQLAALPPAPDAATPLWGVPFAVKDNIDVAGMPTTGACPAFAYTPERSAGRRAAAARPARSWSARPTSTSSPPASWARARRTARCPTRSTPRTSAAARARARPRWWRAAWCHSRSAPTRPARAACPPASTTWSA